MPVGAIRVDDDVNRDVGNKCHYTASVHGTIQPSSSDNKDNKGKTAPMVEPTLNVSAKLDCPNVQMMTITDTVNATGPLTKEQLARAIERRATIASTGPKGTRCLYVPEFTFSDSHLLLQSVSQTCK
jgi:hypothetical protein